MPYFFLILFLIVMVAVLPTWPYSRAWGYGPAGLVGLLFVVLLLIVLLGVL
jgi:hypothetical protein